MARIRARISTELALLLRKTAAQRGVNYKQIAAAALDEFGMPRSPQFWGNLFRGETDFTDETQRASLALFLGLSVDDLSDRPEDGPRPATALQPSAAVDGAAEQVLGLHLDAAFLQAAHLSGDQPLQQLLSTVDDLRRDLERFRKGLDRASVLARREASDRIAAWEASIRGLQGEVFSSLSRLLTPDSIA